MKHIFSVHSPITFLVAYVTIKHLKIIKEDVLILSSSYDVPIDDYKVIPSFHEVRSKNILQKIKNYNAPKAFDCYINSETGGDSFIAYVDLMSYYQKILVTHQNCKSFHFIEEGNSTYQSKDDINDLTWIERKDNFRTQGIDLKSVFRVLRGYNLRLLSLPYIYTAYSNMEDTKFFTFSENAYFSVPSEKKILVKPDKEDRNIRRLAGGYSLKDSCIWLDGSNSRYTGLKESFYHDAINKAIPILKSKGVIQNKVFVKLRPGMKNTSNNDLVKILIANDVEVEIMPNNMIIEAFLMQSEGCKVIGVMTSVLEYAHVFGHKPYSIYGLFEKQPPTFFDRMTGFWENIENLRE